MARDFAQLVHRWGNRLTTLPADYIHDFNLDSETIRFLTTVGLPADLYELEHAIEINFYTSPRKVVVKDLAGVEYLVIGDDAGTSFGISLNDSCVYAIDFSGTLSSDPVCFVNSGVDRFLESIGCFIDFKKRAKGAELSEHQLIELMKDQLRKIDKRALSSGKTWWSQVIDDPIV